MGGADGKAKWWEGLVGCIGPGGTLDANWVGEQRMDWERIPWFVGRGEGFFGLWDRRSPEAPLERWPDDAEGARASWRRRFELVEQPILDATVLDGERWFASVPVPYDETSRVLVQHAEDGQFALIWCSDPPHTSVVLPAHQPAPLDRWIIDRMGGATEVLTLTHESHVHYFFAHDTVEESLAIADLMLQRPRGPWTEVPDLVDSGLLDTLLYIRNGRST